MAFGRKTGGRQKGTPNKISAKFRDALKVVYDGIGGDEGFIEWARENPGDFYRICARTIPLQIDQSDNSPPSFTVVLNQAPRLEHEVVDITPALRVGLGRNADL